MDLRVCSDTASFVHHAAAVLILPVDTALDFTLEVARVLSWQEGHFDVAVGVWLQFTLHWLQE